MIPAVLECCAGIDVGKKFVMVCVLKGAANGEAQSPVRRFETTNDELMRLREWLQSSGCTHVVMESTGEYWRPIFNVLEEEETLQVILANSQQVKALRGHKTDPEDAHWLAHLLRHGMIRPSFIPPKCIRELRDLTRRRRQLVRNGAQERNRIPKVLEGANIKLGNVLSDVFGLSGQLMLDALIEGKATTEQIAQLAKKSAKKKIPQIRAAIEGHRMSAIHRKLIGLSLDHMALLEEQITALDTEITTQIRNSGLERQQQILPTIPGVKQEAASCILAELGPDMTVFGDADHCSSWAGVAPGNNITGGKRKRAPTLRGQSVDSIVADRMRLVGLTQERQRVSAGLRTQEIATGTQAGHCRRRSSAGNHDLRGTADRTTVHKTRRQSYAGHDGSQADPTSLEEA